MSDVIAIVGAVLGTMIGLVLVVVGVVLVFLFGIAIFLLYSLAEAAVITIVFVLVSALLGLGWEWVETLKISFAAVIVFNVVATVVRNALK